MKKLKHVVNTGDIGSVYYHTAQDRKYCLHAHNELELNLVTAGTGTYILANGKYILQTGSLVYFFPGSEHKLINRSPDFIAYIIVYSRKFLENEMDKIFFKTPNHEKDESLCRVLTLKDAEYLEQLITRTYQHKEVNQDLYNASLAYFAYEAWDAFMHADQIQKEKKLHAAVVKAINYLRGADEKCGLEEVARYAGLAPGSLSRYFKKQMGISFAQYRNELLVSRFSENFNPQESNLLDAALEAGFCSYRSFFRCFKQVFGVGPKQYFKNLYTHDN